MKYTFNDISFHDKVLLHEGVFEYYPGLLTVLSGDSGSGKSTLFKLFVNNVNCSL